LAARQTAITDVKLEASPDLICDRVTLYRPLEKYEPSGLVHKLIDSMEKARYTFNFYALKGNMSGLVPALVEAATAPGPSLMYN
jgi:hypothetical protein